MHCTCPVLPHIIQHSYYHLPKDVESSKNVCVSLRILRVSFHF